jgi:hypothetical protein
MSLIYGLAPFGPFPTFTSYCLVLYAVYIRQSPSSPISVSYMHRTPFQITKCHKPTILPVSSISRFLTSNLPVVLPVTSELRIIPSTQVPRKQHSFQPVCIWEHFSSSLGVSREEFFLGHRLYRETWLGSNSSNPPRGTGC